MTQINIKQVQSTNESYVFTNGNSAKVVFIWKQGL